MEIEGGQLIKEKAAEIKKTEAKARQIVQQAVKWREELLAQLKKEKEEVFNRAREEAAREVEEYTREVQSRLTREISQMEKKEKSEEKKLREAASKNFNQAVKEVLELFLKSYGN